jgi:hypothetical protein
VFKDVETSDIPIASEAYLEPKKKRVLSQNQATRGRESAAYAGKIADFQHQISF